MSQYTPITGTITQIDWHGTGPRQLGCSLLFTIDTPSQGIVTMTLDGSAFVLNTWPLQIGDRVTFFYENTAPAPLIFPPRYRTAAAAHTPEGTTAVLDVFTRLPDGTQLAASDGSLRLNIRPETWVTLPNGQPFGGELSGKLMMVLYTTSTRSIPPQTSPEQVVVFCAEEQPTAGLS
ncbi:MAG: hypothetical protein Q4F29_08650 [Lachnospiraceae bacterium]|nr:hypothetical protein [Lachnospiraceae bacterium]